MESKPKLLVCELWGLGDLTLATALIDRARSEYEVHLLAKPHARDLLRPTYPDVIFHDYVAPWTAHYHKYDLWKWDWPKLFQIVVDLRVEHFDAAVSVRLDPRDHFLMWLSGAKRRIGFPTKGSGVFLHDHLHEPKEKWHRVESYRELGRRLDVVGIETANPRIDAANYRTDKIAALTPVVGKPIVTAHLGAGQPVRRWPEEYWRQILQQLRAEFDFFLVIASDPDAFGKSLEGLADAFVSDLTVAQLVDLMGRSSLVLCHDSGPMHIAAACGVSTIAFFGPGQPRWFRPWGEIHRIVIRDICPYRPCFDFCRFSENLCLTQMKPAQVWPEVRSHFERIVHQVSARSEMPTNQANVLKQ